MTLDSTSLTNKLSTLSTSSSFLQYSSIPKPKIKKRNNYSLTRSSSMITGVSLVNKRLDSAEEGRRFRKQIDYLKQTINFLPYRNNDLRNRVRNNPMNLRSNYSAKRLNFNAREITSQSPTSRKFVEPGGLMRKICKNQGVYRPILFKNGAKLRKQNSLDYLKVNTNELNYLTQEAKTTQSIGVKFKKRCKLIKFSSNLGK